jgi:hypothetical protein
MKEWNRQNHNILFLRGSVSWHLGERVEGELGDGEELVLGDETLGAAVELAEALVQRHDLLLRDCSRIKLNTNYYHKKRNELELS